MMRIKLALCLPLLLWIASQVAAQTPSPEQRSFDLHPQAVPVPLLKTRLLFGPAEQRPGNAALVYLRAELLLGEKTSNEVAAAMDAMDGGGLDGFQHAAEAATDRPALFDLIDQAGRCRDADWSWPSLRDRGFFALLPELNSARGLANLVQVRAVLQIRQGQLDAALDSLRLGYAMVMHLRREPVMVTQLVAAGMQRMFDRALIELMNRPDAPNLYGALLTLPPQQWVLPDLLAGQQQGAVATFPLLGRSYGGEFSTDDWKSLVQQVNRVQKVAKPSAPPLSAEMSAAQLLPLSTPFYAASWSIPESEAAEHDPMEQAAAFVVAAAQRAWDQAVVRASVPYPQFFANSGKSLMETAAGLPPALQPFHAMFPPADLHEQVLKLALADREIAALAAVEALSDYAATHDGHLPQHLADITARPVPLNPWSGQPFDYRLNGQQAMLSDRSIGEHPLRYTVFIAK